MGPTGLIFSTQGTVLCIFSVPSLDCLSYSEAGGEKHVVRFFIVTGSLPMALKYFQLAWV